MKKLTYLFFVVVTSLVCSSPQSADLTAENNASMKSAVVFGNQDLDVPNNELPKLEDEAISGSADAARRLSSFYDMVKHDDKQATHWAQIEAENGSPIGQYRYAFRLYKDPDPKVRARARYWLGLALKNGVPHAASLLKEMDENEKR